MRPKKTILFLNAVLLLIVLGTVFEGSLYSSAVTEETETSCGPDTEEIDPEVQRREFIRQLSDEFGIDEEIVSIVEGHARANVNNADPEWRLVQTPEFLTHIMLSLIHAESRGNASAVGDGGRAVGLTQIWLSTAQQYAPVSRDELLDPETNIELALQHFRYLLRKYEGNLALALYSWNRGEGTVDRLIRYGRPPNNSFAPRVYRASVIAQGNRVTD